MCRIPPLGAWIVARLCIQLKRMCRSSHGGGRQGGWAATGIYLFELIIMDALRLFSFDYLLFVLILNTNARVNKQW